MRLTSKLAAVGAALAFAAVSVAAALPGEAAQAPAAAAPVRIMPLGDSITGSPGCWRALLWNRLQSTGYTNIDFVGTQGAQGCGVPYDGDGEGHGGALVTAVADQNQLVGWLAASRPDVVLMHFGTNDVWSSKPVDQILAAYTKLLEQMRASNAGMKLLVAQIIPLAPPTCPDCGARAVALNNAIPGWAAAHTTAASPVVVVDQWTGFNTATDTGDGVHPNDAGNQKISDRWYPALTAALNNSPQPSPTTALSPTRSPSPTPSRTSAPCTATYQIVSQWPGGFQGQVTVRNTGTASFTGWTTGFTFTNGERITNSWMTVLSQTGAVVTASHASWNATLAPGASTVYGFTGSGTSGTPAVSCTSGIQ